MQVDSCNITISSKEYETIATKTEKWFGTKYHSEGKFYAVNFISN